MNEPVDVDAAQFAEITSGATVPVLVDFWAPWCGPRKMAAPAVAKAAANLAGGAIVLNVSRVYWDFTVRQIHAVDEQAEGRVQRLRELAELARFSRRVPRATRAHVQ